MRIKIKNLDIDGSPTDIHDLFQKQDIKLDEFLEKNKTPHIMWLLSSAILFLALNLCIHLKAFDGNWHLSCIVLGIASFALILSVIQRKYDSNTITGICGIIGIGILGITIANVTPENTVRKIDEKLPNIMGTKKDGSPN